MQPPEPYQKQANNAKSGRQQIMNAAVRHKFLPRQNEQAGRDVFKPGASNGTDHREF